MMKATICVVLAMSLAGCCQKQQPVSVDVPLRLTTEEVLQANDGDRIIVYYPEGTEKPVVFQSNETGGWVVSGRVIGQ